MTFLTTALTVIAAILIPVLYCAGMNLAMHVVTDYIKVRVLTKSKSGRVLAVILWPVAFVLLVCIVLGRKLNNTYIQPLVRDWKEMLAHD